MLKLLLALGLIASPFSAKIAWEDKEGKWMAGYSSALRREGPRHFARFSRGRRRK